MLPRNCRLTKDRDISRVFTKGRRFITPFFSFHVLKTPHGSMRFAFVVSQKVGKRASARNLVKRRARAAVATHLPFKGSYDVVITGRVGVVTYSTPRVKGTRTPHGNVASYKDIAHLIDLFFMWLSKEISRSSPRQRSF